jgi:hypothetical protein
MNAIEMNTFQLCEWLREQPEFNYSTSLLNCFFIKEPLDVCKVIHDNNIDGCMFSDFKQKDWMELGLTKLLSNRLVSISRQSLYSFFSKEIKILLDDVHKELAYNFLLKNQFNRNRMYYIRVDDHIRDDYYIQKKAIEEGEDVIQLFGAERYFDNTYPHIFITKNNFLRYKKITIHHNCINGRHIEDIPDIELNVNRYAEIIDIEMDTYNYQEYQEERSQEERPFILANVVSESSQSTKNVLGELADKLDAIKQNMQDNQYKEMMELMMKLYPK